MQIVVYPIGSLNKTADLMFKKHLCVDANNYYSWQRGDKPICLHLFEGDVYLVDVPKECLKSVNHSKVKIHELTLSSK